MTGFPSKQKYQHHILLVTAMATWGLAWPVAKILVSGLPPLLVGSWRFIFASLFFLTATIANPNMHFMKLTKSSFQDFFFLGLSGIFGYGVFFLFGLQYTTSTLGSIIAGVNPAVITLIAFVVFKQRLPRKWQYSGLFISFLGVIFVIGISSVINYHPEYLLGNLIILTAMFCWGTYSNLGSRAMKKYSTFITTSYAVYFGALLFILSSIIDGSFVDLSNYNLTLFLGTLFLGAIVTFLGFFFYFVGVQKVGASQAGIYINLVPIFGSFSSWLILNDPIYPTFIIGLLFIILGIIIINYPINSTDTQEKENS